MSRPSASASERVNGTARITVNGSREDAPDERQIGVVIVEDHAALRKGLELLLRSHGHRVVGSADAFERARHLIVARRPDVALIDINLAGASGTLLARHLLLNNPDLGILLYSGVEDPEALSEALDCGARGFALKAGAPEELMDALRAVARGDSWVDPRLAGMIERRPEKSRLEKLTPREREVLDLLAEGLSGEQIARRLYLSPETVRTHVRNAMEKLDARTRTHAVAIAVRERPIAVGPSVTAA
jgi:DNA-binding NarL/FixJ family response regulator